MLVEIYAVPSRAICTQSHNRRAFWRNAHKLTSLPSPSNSLSRICLAIVNQCPSALILFSFYYFCFFLFVSLFEYLTFSFVYAHHLCVSPFTYMYIQTGKPVLLCLARFGPWFMRFDPVEIAVEACSQSVGVWTESALCFRLCSTHHKESATLVRERERDSEVCCMVNSRFTCIKSIDALLNYTVCGLSSIQLVCFSFFKSAWLIC